MKNKLTIFAILVSATFLAACTNTNAPSEENSDTAPATTTQETTTAPKSAETDTIEAETSTATEFDIETSNYKFSVYRNES